VLVNLSSDPPRYRNARPKKRESDLRRGQISDDNSRSCILTCQSNSLAGNERKMTGYWA
jgi:hypothetical protein